MLGPALTAAMTSDRDTLEVVERVPLRPPFPRDLVGVLEQRLERLRQRAMEGSHHNALVKSVAELRPSRP